MDCKEITSGLLEPEMTPEEEAILLEELDDYREGIKKTFELENGLENLYEMFLTANSIEDLKRDIEYNENKVGLGKMEVSESSMEYLKTRLSIVEASLMEDLSKTRRYQEISNDDTDAYSDNSTDEKINQLLSKTRRYQEISNDDIEDPFEKRINKNIHYLDDILGEPDEIMARITSSMYSLCYGELTMDCIPTNDQDRVFLGRFRDYGKQVFKKGIERSMVRDEMVRDGYSPQEAKDMLEHATSFEYNGRKYSWPEADFTIKGKIPLLGYGDGTCVIKSRN